MKQNVVLLRQGDDFMKKVLLVFVIMFAFVLSACSDDGDGTDGKAFDSYVPIVEEI